MNSMLYNIALVKAVLFKPSLISLCTDWDDLGIVYTQPSAHQKG